MPEIVMDTGRDAVLLVGGGSLCAAAVPLLRAAGLVPAGVIHGPRCDFAAEAGVPPLGRDADLARLRRDFSRAVVTAPHKQAARLRRLLHEALREQGFTLVSAVHPEARRERDVLVGAGNLIFADVSLAAGCRTGTGCVLWAGARLEAGCRLGDHVHVGEGSHLGADVIVEEGAHLGREVRVEAGLRLEKNIFVPDSVHLTRQTLPLYVAGGAREDRA
ncbi:hypothetical protein [uncultured Desulfovibrio sp.]|uniref:hypothetical protein n=1 Tax=uncultured Desulfovibrio sp. TaxID=167968 RepID=UPI0025D63E1E|nr:hypothetical protein [uncultured Desulfovibrio sp.]